MNPDDQITICLLTYNRFDYAEKTLRTVLDKIKTRHRLGLHIADDGSPGDYVDRLRRIAGGYPGLTGITTSNADRGGYGKNVNLAMQVVHSFSRYVLMLEDDWKLERELPLDPLLTTLDTAPSIGCIRLGYMGFTQELRGHIEFWEQEHYLVFDPDSDEPHVFAGHPRVEAVAWQRNVGPWIEGLAPGATEFHMAKIPRSRQRVAWPLDLVAPSGDLFSHIGTERAY